MAEEVGYSVVWEVERDKSNVIDYNIRKEQTKDNFAIENANNQTTTGMATQIPWINEPKLIAKTSIIWDLWWWGGSIIWDAEIALATNTNTPPDTKWRFNILTITSWWEWWTIDWYLMYPVPWTYVITRVVQTNNTYRYITNLNIYILRWWTPIDVWNAWNNEDIYYWTTWFTLIENDIMVIEYRYTWWSANHDTNWTMRFIRIR